MSDTSIDKVTIVIKTLLRPRALRRCIRSIRKMYPSVKILVADDSGYKTYDGSAGHVDGYFLLPQDSGASYGRNYLVRQVDTEYVMVVDDDTVFDESTRIEFATDVLDTRPNLDIVAGYYRPGRWWGELELDLPAGVLYRRFHKASEVVDGFPVYDFVPQFYVGRTVKVRAVGWDDDLKTLDHLQFAWRARGKLNATVLPYFSSFNTSERNPEYDRYRWNRLKRFRRLQLQKLGRGVRRIEDVWGQDNLRKLEPPLDPLALHPPEGLIPFHRTLVIGLGSGRSGSFTLSRLLQAQFKHLGTDVTHERKPLLKWDSSREEVWAHLDGLHEPDLGYFGDVAFYYLPHVETIIDWAQQKQVRVRFVCMRRDRDGTVNSYIEKVRPFNSNHWMDHDGSRWRLMPMWDPTYPKFDHCETLEEALGAYWDQYYKTAECLAEKHPDCFGLYELEDLNYETRLWSLLQFVGTSKRLRVPVGARLNTREPARSRRGWSPRNRLAGPRVAQRWIGGLGRILRGWLVQAMEALREPQAQRDLDEDSSDLLGSPPRLPVWYINLARSTGRRRFIEQQLHSAGVTEVERIPGVDGAGIENIHGGEVDGEHFANEEDHIVNCAELGATLSHLRVARTFCEEESGLEVICVVEDDVCFDGFREWPDDRLVQLVRNAPPDWNIIQLYCNNPDVLQLLALHRDTAPLLRRERIDVVCKAWSAGAYLLRRRGAQLLMDQFLRDESFHLDGGRVIADRLIYRIPGVYLATDIMFSTMGLGSLIADHHNRVDRVSELLTRALFAPSTAYDSQSDVSPPVVFCLDSLRDGASSMSWSEVARRGGLEGNGTSHVRVRAIEAEDINPDIGEVWGVPFENRCEQKDAKSTLAQTLSVLKCLYMMHLLELDQAMVLETHGLGKKRQTSWLNKAVTAFREGMGNGWDVCLIRPTLNTTSNERPSGGRAQPLTLWVTQSGARAVLDELFRDNRFVLTGPEPEITSLLKRSCRVKIVTKSVLARGAQEN